MNTIENTQNTVDPSNMPNKSHLNWYIIGATMFVLVVIIIVLVAILMTRTAQTPESTDLQVTLATSEPKTVTPASIQPITDQGVTWLPEPQLLSQDLGLMTLEPDATDTSVKYYLFGKDNGVDIILAVAPSYGPGNDRHMVFLKTAIGYDMLAKNSDVFNTGTDITQDNNYFGPPLGKNVKIDYEKKYMSVLPPDTLIITNANLKKQYARNYWYSDYTTKTDNVLTKESETQYGTLYRLERKDAMQPDVPITTTTVQAFVLRTINGTAFVYQYIPTFVSDSGIPQITWSDGTTNKDTFRWDKLSGGCGTPGYVNVLDPKFSSDLSPVGKTSSGEIVYGFSNPSSQTVQEQFKSNMPDGTYYKFDEKSNASTTVSISATEYLQKHGLFVYKDPLGRNILFTNFTYGPQAECGKPVIYLYPTKPTNVSVKVGAKITKSEPAYGTDGWSVKALPSGEIINADGKSYDSLFWEGTGKDYPEIFEGFIVKQSELVVTLKDHLEKLGLNKKESADFMAFWLPKMPQTPYIRLTWFGTKQMDRLAPLSINPAPDSVIRIFLDFAGMEKPIAFKSQTLRAIPRNGFTVVEWGGLLKK